MRKVLFVVGVLFLITGGTNAVVNGKEVYADKVLVLKSQRILHLYKDGESIRQYQISLGQNPKGHKQRQGDSRTPEGHYIIDFRNPKSRFHLSLHINYPSSKDRAAAHKRGVSPGGDIFIHGLPNGLELGGRLYRRNDWTDGCIAVSNEEIREIWRMVKNGTPIEIRP